MIRTLSFWKYKAGIKTNDEDIHQKLSAGVFTDEVEELPADRILAEIKNKFADWNWDGDKSFALNEEMAELFITGQFVRFDCHNLSYKHMNRLIDLMDKYGCPLYDAAISVRFEAKSIKEILEEFDSILENKLKIYGFKKKKKRTLRRSTGDCIQDLIVSDTKVAGQERAHIYILVSFTLKKINKLIMYLQNDYRYKGWATFVVNLNTLIPGKNVFGFYIDQNTDLNAVAESVAEMVKKYGLPFLESCDSNEKLAYEIEKDNKVIVNQLSHKLGWIKLALHILMHHPVSAENIGEYLPEITEDSDICKALPERMNNQEELQKCIK